MTLSEIQIRDPFVLPVPSTGTYHLFGTTDKNCWQGPGTGFDSYRSRDLLTWEGPFPAFRPAPGFWADTQFWAPEAHAHGGRFFLLATFKAGGRCRGTQVLVADAPDGLFVPWSDGPVTPPDRECLDGTLHVDADGVPWMVFCHEWAQIRDGGMCALPLSGDLRRAAGAPVELFHASDAPWVHPLPGVEKQEIVEAIDEAPAPAGPCYVTDGPFLHRTADGTLLMLWSSFGTSGYAMGLARSGSGTVRGPWTHDPAPLWVEDGGHGMFFRAFDGRLFLTLHQPNVTPRERARLHEAEEDGGTLRLAAQRRIDPG